MRANMGYTAAQVLKTPVNSGHVAPSARFFFVHGFSYGRECDGYKTRKGKKSARLFTGFELLPTPAQNGVFSLEQEPTMAQHAQGALAPVIPLPTAAKHPITNRRRGRLPRMVIDHGVYLLARYRREQAAGKASKAAQDLQAAREDRDRLLHIVSSLNQYIAEHTQTEAAHV